MRNDILPYAAEMSMRSLNRPGLQNSSPNINQRYRWWHEAIIEDMLAFPLSTLKERAARLGYSYSYLSLLINSDMFQLMYRKRKDEHAELLTTSLVEKTSRVAGTALDLMLESMERKRTDIPFPVLADTANKTLNALGYGTKPAAPAVTVVQQNNAALISPPVSREELSQAREALHRSERARLLPPSNPSPEEAVDAARLVTDDPSSCEA